MSAVEPALARYFDSFGERLAELRNTFMDAGYLEIPEFGPPVVTDQLVSEVSDLLEKHAQRRQVRVASTGGTPRYLETVARDALAEHSVVIPDTYRSPALRKFLAELSREPEIVPVPWPPEEMVISRMNRKGDCHGWHWDDYPYVLVWVIETPPPGDGGWLEYIRGTHWNKEDPRIEKHLSWGTIERQDPPAGSVYFLRADTAMHSVAPLARDGVQRIVLCFTYATPADLEREVTHETVDALY